MKKHSKLTQQAKTLTYTQSQKIQHNIFSTQEYNKIQKLLYRLGLQEFIQTLGSYLSRQILTQMQDVFYTDSLYKDFSQYKDTLHYQDSLKKDDSQHEYLTQYESKDSLKPQLFSQNILCNQRMLSYLFSQNMQQMHTFILALESVQLPKLPCIKILDSQLLALGKNATLRLSDIFQFMQMLHFFYHFTKQQYEHESLQTYCNNFVFPQEIIALMENFDFESTQAFQEDSMWHCIKNGVDKELDLLQKTLESTIKEKQNELYHTLNLNNLQEYLVDKQLHFIENKSCLLVRSGYSKVIHAKIIGRSTHGFFYIIPLSLESIQNKIYHLQDRIHEKILLLCKQYSQILNQHIHFLYFMNQEYDFIDNAFARLCFAKDYNFEFVVNGFTDSKKDTIILHEYSHPELKNPKPISITMQKNLLMITGVNAGGKTMLLKSILSALFCAKMLVPMRINATKSFLPHIKNIALIAQDPQDSKNDISTFSGRIKEFQVFLHTQELILGIDEIEIGTDSNEAASLYKVLLEELLKNHAKIIVTTHHKHLVSLFANNPQTQLLAAVYDYKHAKPTFEFIEGIGKSYAMECARIYGIPQNLIDKAQELHGKEANRLEKLIESSYTQITKNKQDSIKLQNLITEYQDKIANLDNLKQTLKRDFETQSLELKRHYNEAIKEIKMLAKQSSKNLQTLTNTQDLQGTQHTLTKIHKLLTKTHKAQLSTPKINIESTRQYAIGEWIKYKNKLAKIIEKNHNTYVIETTNGLKIKAIKSIDLTPAHAPKQMQSYGIEVEKSPQTKLDLHGFTKEEALESLESFISQAIVSGFHEVIIVHGLGNGILKKVVQDYLSNCPHVRGFLQAPSNMGGSGAKIVYLH